MKKNILFLLLFTFMLLNSQAQTITDIDGNIYNTITLGTQIWTKENLKTTRFSNGDSIATTSLPINNDSTSIFQWPYNQDSLNIPVYGRLYTWYAVTDIRNVCPAGWHVPSEAEWMSLANFLGGDTLAGDKMKETGTSHWLSTTGTVTNSSDFTALPGGGRGNPTGFSNLTP
ncbi:MAG: fibrobacter succinogenes major paralogous domain-containing protein [Bacteroidetes bacterium]|nr:fibrobacter succinogenes major paralogous domain-containing protein [Bacteroidota bacterium]